MSIDPILINKINKKIIEENQSENLADEILDYLKKKDLDQLNTEERIKLILVGCISLILMQVMIHIGVNIRLFPTTGMTLPFISYGGSSIISISILSGIILNLTKRRV